MRYKTINYALAMKVYIPIVLYLALSSVAGAQEAYKSVDEHGNTVFSDTPTKNSEKIELKEIQTVPALQNYPVRTNPAELQESYNDIVISSPEEDATIWDNEGKLSVSVSMDPVLRGSDTLTLYLDGKEHSSGQSTGFNLTGIDRGTHSLRASIRNSRGNIIKSSKTVTFHLQQHSILNPQLSNTPGQVSPTNPPRSLPPAVPPANPG